MKLKKILAIFTIFLVLIIALITILDSKSLNDYIFSIKSSYCNIKNNDIFNIDLYFNNKKTELTNKKSINNAYITNNLETIKFEIEIKDIYYNEEIIKNSTYIYSYTYDVKVKNIISNLKIDEAYLIINTDLEDAKINIGSINFLLNEYETFDFLGLYGITNIYENTEYLAALVLKIDNLKYNYINKLISLDDNYIFDLENAKILLNNDFSHNIDLSSIYDDYNLYINYENNNDNINYKINDYYILIPIKYYKLIYLSDISFLIDIDNISYISPKLTYFKINDLSLMNKYLVLNEINRIN